MDNEQTSGFINIHRPHRTVEPFDACKYCTKEIKFEAPQQMINVG